MWNVNSDDVRRAKERAQARRAEIEAKYNEEMSALNADITDIETLERVAAEFASRHAKPVAEEPADEALSEPEPEPEAPAEPMAASGDVDEPPRANGGEGKSGSRWRLHLGNREGEATLPAHR